MALWGREDQHHLWAVAVARAQPPPWITCEAVWSEAEHLLGAVGRASLRKACERGALRLLTPLSGDLQPILNLLAKYQDVPMRVADACLVRLTEVLPDPLLLTTDNDFRIYRRHGRKMVPCLLP